MLLSSSALISLAGSNLISLAGSNLISIPGSNLISFLTAISSAFLGSNLWLLRDAFTPGCHQILSSHGPYSPCTKTWLLSLLPVLSKNSV
ncbi:unnamed protein product [Staurois parvus]|uniref:Uncharacterized protein n=1 Tax=Staurois parvus TaxID=386267 RepID=A0ABN9CD72_9NEOB|nr:unnamed protein product [Staurois parvus]